MKRCLLGVVFMLLVGLLVSCASIPVAEIVAGDNESLIVVQRTKNYVGSAIPIEVLINGRVVASLGSGGVTRFTVPNGQHTIKIQGKFGLTGKDTQEREMSFEAFFQQITFTMGIDGASGGLNLVKTNQSVLAGREQQYANRNPATAGTGVEGALARAAKDVFKNVPARSRIAIVYITAQDRSQTDYIAGELEVIWVNEGYIIIDRSQLDRIRREQNFQMSGEVDDNTAVSIGKIIGANIIVTGRVDGEGNLRRLRLRALNTQTAQVVGAASERL